MRAAASGARHAAARSWRAAIAIQAGSLAVAEFTRLSASSSVLVRSRAAGDRPWAASGAVSNGRLPPSH
eukprot:scaffold83300_cov64-Phaeocystis_antarctica.AAC.3